MRILHRMSKRDRERKGHGLNGDPPMPDDQDSARDDGFSGFSAADKAVLELAAAKTPILGPAARSRGRHLAGAMHDGLGGDALAELLPHLHWMEWAYEQKIFPASTWGPAIAAVQAACHELNTAHRPVSDEQADKLLRAALKRETL